MIVMIIVIRSISISSQKKCDTEFWSDFSMCKKIHKRPLLHLEASRWLFSQKKVLPCMIGSEMSISLKTWPS